MERVSGVELSTRWETLNDADRTLFLKDYFPIEKKLSEIEIQSMAVCTSKTMYRMFEFDVIFDQYVVGPTTSSAFMNGKDNDMDTDRGPCISDQYNRANN